MKKSSKYPKYLIVLICFLVSFVGAFAADVYPSKLPLTTDSLKAYGLAHVNRVSSQVYAQTLTGSAYVDLAYPFTDADPKHMSYALSAAAFQFTVDPSVNIDSYANYDGFFGDPSNPTRITLFYGWKQFSLQNTNGVYSVPADAFKIHMDLSDWVPVYIPGIVSAQMDITDDNGNVIDSYDFNYYGRVWAQQGLLFIGADVLDQKGKVIVNLSDGTELVYNATGARVPLVTVNSSLASFDGIIDGVRSAAADVPVVAYQPNDRIVRVAFTKNATLSVSFPAGDYESPVSVRIVDTVSLANDPSAGDAFNLLQTSVSEPILAGKVYLLIFEYAPDPRVVDTSTGKG